MKQSPETEKIAGDRESLKLKSIFQKLGPVSGCLKRKRKRKKKKRQMAHSFGIVVVPPCTSATIPGDRLFKPNFSHIFSVSSGRIILGTGVISVRRRRDASGFSISGCLSPDSSSSSSSSIPLSSSGTKTKLYVSGLSFRTTEDNLRDTFEQFGKLVHMNLVMDKVANRPRGFAFLRYETEEEATKAIQGMHGKFLDGRVIFVEEAKSRSDIAKAKPRPDFPKAQTKPRTFRTW